MVEDINRWEEEIIRWAKEVTETQREFSWDECPLPPEWSIQENVEASDWIDPKTGELKAYIIYHLIVEEPDVIVGEISEIRYTDGTFELEVDF